MTPEASARTDTQGGLEAIALPLLFLTVAAAGGLRIAPAGALQFVPPPLGALVLAMLLIGVLARGGVLQPDALMSAARTPLANVSGAVVMVTLFAACAQVINALLPEAGLLRVAFAAGFALLLLNTLAAAPTRASLLRALLVTFGGAFTAKYIVLTALYDPAGGMTRRVLLAVIEGVTLGTLAYEPPAGGTGYVAFLAIIVFLIALALLPVRPPRRSLDDASSLVATGEMS